MKQKLIKYKDIEHTHWCGCVTMKYKKGIAFKKMCKKHYEDKKYIWIVFQHPMEEKER
jgi:hypothetical protein